jgi:putative methionine-R-sulfoxide reductase with GAF domain
MSDDNWSRLEELVIAVVGTVVSTFLLDQFLNYRVLEIAGVALVFALAISFTTGALVRRAARKQAETYVDVLAKLYARQQQTFASSNIEAYVQEYFRLICEESSLRTLNNGVAFLLDQSNSWLVASFFSAHKGRSSKRFFVGSEKQQHHTSAPGVSGTAFRENRVIIVRFRRGGRANNPMYHRFTVRPTSEYRCFAACPIRVGGKPVGILSLESNRKYGIVSSQTAYYQALADCLGNAIYQLGTGSGFGSGGSSAEDTALPSLQPVPPPHEQPSRSSDDSDDGEKGG